MLARRPVWPDLAIPRGFQPCHAGDRLPVRLADHYRAGRNPTHAIRSGRAMLHRYAILHRDWDGFCDGSFSPRIEPIPQEQGDSIVTLTHLSGLDAHLWHGRPVRGLPVSLLPALEMNALLVFVGVSCAVNLIVSIAVLRSPFYSTAQKFAQCGIVWLVPILGSVGIWSFLRAQHGWKSYDTRAYPERDEKMTALEIGDSISNSSGQGADGGSY